MSFADINLDNIDNKSDSSSISKANHNALGEKSLSARNQSSKTMVVPKLNIKPIEVDRDLSQKSQKEP